MSENDEYDYADDEETNHRLADAASTLITSASSTSTTLTSFSQAMTKHRHQKHHHHHHHHNNTTTNNRTIALAASSAPSLEHSDTSTTKVLFTTTNATTTATPKSVSSSPPKRSRLYANEKRLWPWSKPRQLLSAENTNLSLQSGPTIFSHGNLPPNFRSSNIDYHPPNSEWILYLSIGVAFGIILAVFVCIVLLLKKLGRCGGRRGSVKPARRQPAPDTPPPSYSEVMLNPRLYSEVIPMSGRASATFVTANDNVVSTTVEISGDSRQNMPSRSPCSDRLPAYDSLVGWIRKSIRVTDGKQQRNTSPFVGVVTSDDSAEESSVHGTSDKTFTVSTSIVPSSRNIGINDDDARALSAGTSSDPTTKNQDEQHSSTAF